MEQHMKLFIWEYASDLTTNYHSGGGCAIIAESLEAARDLFKESDPNSQCSLLTNDPDFTSEVSATEARLFVFQDAGCC
jgi:hypothetical protein